LSIKEDIMEESPRDRAGRDILSEREIAFWKEHTPDDINGYFEDKSQRIARGESVWMARNFDSDGIYFDYYVSGEVVAGLAVGGWDGHAYEVFAEGLEDAYETLESALDGVEHHFTTQ
jgi:hypothetical protein